MVRAARAVECGKGREGGGGTSAMFRAITIKKSSPRNMRGRGEGGASAAPGGGACVVVLFGALLRHTASRGAVVHMVF